MTHLTCQEWGRVVVGSDGGFSREQANALLAAARAHPRGGREGTDILVDHHRHLSARQMVGLLSSGGASLEILPKVDPETPNEPAATVRSRLVHMLDVTLGLDLSCGQEASLARQDETLLDVLIRLFADQLLVEVRRGLPRLYQELDDDLSALRGRLDIVRQFTVHAVRPDRLACRFDSLESDTPLMRVMKACVVMLTHHARHFETRRRLEELRFVLAEVPDVAKSRLPWDQVHIDRTNRRWRSLFAMAKLFLRQEWQATHHAVNAPEGVTLLFPMNDLFEGYIAAKLRSALADTDLEVVAQGGCRHCLGDWSADINCEPHLFLTRPDLILRQGGRNLAIIDTKWKKLGDAIDPKIGVGQGDVYQMMAYARLYDCQRLTLLYPSRPGQGSHVLRRFGIGGGPERLSIATVDIAAPDQFPGALRQMALAECGAG